MQDLKDRISDLQARHEHEYQWTDDPGILRGFSQRVAWPTDIPPQLSGLTRCPTCGQVDLVNWTSPPRAEIPSSLYVRLEGYALAQDATLRGAPSCQRSGLTSAP